MSARRCLPHTVLKVSLWNDNLHLNRPSKDKPGQPVISGLERACIRETACFSAAEEEGLSLVVANAQGRGRLLFLSPGGAGTWVTNGDNSLSATSLWARATRSEVEARRCH